MFICRLKQLCKMLVENSFKKWFHLQHAEDPCTWAGTHEFEEGELADSRPIATACLPATDLREFV